VFELDARPAVVLARIVEGRGENEVILDIGNVPGKAISQFAAP
jgi:hypothetical protein